MIRTHLKDRTVGGFTLVEILVVMVILATLGGMIVAAVQGVTASVRESRTKSIIAACDTVIQQQYESYKYRPLSVEIPDLAYETSGGEAEVGLEPLATESARVRVMMTRDLQRMELPDRFTDITYAPTRMYAAANRVILVGGTIVRADDTHTSKRKSFPVAWFGTRGSSLVHSGSDDVPSRMAAYLARTPDVTSLTAAELNLLYQNQSAECLYLIMANSFVAGTPAIDAIPESNIGDTDQDGMLEILDGWGNPLGFIRWPVGYVDPSGVVSPYLADGDFVADEFDLFRTDFSYVNGTTNAQPYYVDTSVTSPTRPWSLRPLIISAGEDGEFGIALNPFESPATDPATDELVDFAYADTSTSDGTPAFGIWPRDCSAHGRRIGGSQQYVRRGLPNDRSVYADFY